MKKVDLEIIKPKDDTGIKSINQDHKALFNYIEKLQDIVNQPQDHQYAISILESFITFFLEHVIKEEQLLHQYLPDNVVEEHALLHQRELIYLDESVIKLKTKLSSHNIQTIVDELNSEFKSHIYRYDKNIMQKLMSLKRKIN
jgi:hemerythrin